MKLIWKILIFVGALWFIGSAMTAAPTITDMENLNIPGCWEFRGDGFYVNTIHGEHISVKNASGYTSLDDFITNDTAEGYLVEDISGNGSMYSYTWNLDTGYEFGYLQVVCVNGTNYLMSVDYTAEQFDSYMGSGDAYGEELLKQINELNGLEQVQI